MDCKNTQRYSQTVPTHCSSVVSRLSRFLSFALSLFLNSNVTGLKLSPQ